MRIITIIQQCFGDTCLDCEQLDICAYEAYYQKWLEVMIKPCLERNTLNLATFLYMLNLDVRLDSEYDSSEKTYLDKQKELVKRVQDSLENTSLDSHLWGDL